MTEWLNWTEWTFKLKYQFSNFYFVQAQSWRLTLQDEWVPSWQQPGCLAKGSQINPTSNLFCESIPHSQNPEQHMNPAGNSIHQATVICLHYKTPNILFITKWCYFFSSIIELLELTVLNMEHTLLPPILPLSTKPKPKSYNRALLPLSYLDHEVCSSGFKELKKKTNKHLSCLMRDVSLVFGFRELMPAFQEWAAAETQPQAERLYCQWAWNSRTYFHPSKK